jgi:hypothetical protein
LLNPAGNLPPILQTFEEKIYEIADSVHGENDSPSCSDNTVKLVHRKRKREVTTAVQEIVQQIPLFVYAGQCGDDMFSTGFDTSEWSSAKGL